MLAHMFDFGSWKLSWAAVAFSLVCPCEASVSMKAVPMFGGYAREDGWRAIWIDITYSGNPTKAVLSAKNKGIAGPRPCASRRSIDLATGAHKAFPLLVSKPRSGVTVVTLSDGSKELAYREVTFREVKAGDLLIVSLSPDSQAFTHLGGLPSPYGTNAKIYTVAASSQQLPDHWQAYDPVDVLIVTDDTPPPSHETQVEAIGQWVAAGGCLVMAATKGGMGFRNPLWAELLPGKITGSRELPEAKALGDRYGGRRARQLVALCELSSGYAACAHDGAPLVAFKENGLGTVAFVAFDITGEQAKVWPGTELLWRDILSWVRPKVEPGEAWRNQNRGNWQDNIFWALGDMPGAKTTEFGFLLWVLIAYVVVLGPVNYLMLRKIKRKEWSLFTIPVTALAFGLGTYAVGAAQKGGKAFLNEISVLRTRGGSSVASGTGYFAAFAPARTKVGLTFGKQRLLAEEIVMRWPYGRSRREKHRPACVLQQSVPWGVNTLMHMWTMRTFRTRFVRELPGTVEDTLCLQNGITGNITNNLPWHLEDCVLTYCGNRAAKFKRIDAGQTVPIKWQASVTPHTWDWQVGRASADKLHSAFNYNQNKPRGRAVKSFAADAELAGLAPLLLGWVQEPMLSPDVSPFDPERKIQEALLAVELPLTVKAETDRVSGHASRIRLVELKAESSLRGFLQNGKLRNGHCVILFEPPRGAPIQKTKTLSIAVPLGSWSQGGPTGSRKSGKAEKWALEVYNWARHAWDKLDAKSGSVSVPKPLEHMSRPEGRILMRVTVKGEPTVSVPRVSIGYEQKRGKK